MGSLISGAVAIGCICFVLSLPIGSTQLGQTLKRWAVFCFIAAFAPSVVFSLFCSGAHGAASSTGSGTNPLSALGGLALLSGIAYGVLKLRARFSRPQRDAWSEYIGQRSAGKRVVDDRERRRDDLIDL